ncbi:MAG: hypothetical protein PUB07_03005 [Clostridia bacterium]|nr:hypothetical protein [Clostridia bacterium]
MAAITILVFGLSLSCYSSAVVAMVTNAYRATTPAAAVTNILYSK